MEEYHPMCHSYCPKNTPSLRLGVLQLLFCLEFSDSSSRRSREPLLLTFLLNLHCIFEAVAVWLWIPFSSRFSQWIGFFGKILTGKSHIKNGKIDGFRLRFSHENQSIY